MATALWVLAFVLVIAGIISVIRRKSWSGSPVLSLVSSSAQGASMSSPDPEMGRPFRRVAPGQAMATGVVTARRGPTGLHVTRSIAVGRSKIVAGGGPARVLELHEDGGKGVVRLVGELDTETAPQLRRRLEEHPGATVLDLQDVTFVNSTGLGVLLFAARACDDADQLTLRSPSAHVRRVLELAGLIESFRIEPDASA